jgi:hypothetical protein
VRLIGGAAAAALAVVLASACADLKTAGDEAADDAGDGTSADAAGDGSSPAPGELPPGTGPGPHGALPSGYCCTDDRECRYRRCVDTGGGVKMCLDECFQDGFCERPDVTFTCDQPEAGQRGLCQPPPGFACLPQSEFVRGTRETGGCCAFGMDGTAGSECDGNQCVAVADGPYVCTNRCDSGEDCPSSFTCTMFGTSKACIPANAPYTCG